MLESPEKLPKPGRLMYQMHPDRASLFAGDPPEPAQAAENVQTIRFDDLLEMRQVVWDLAGFIEEWKPDLVPFFATGGIPYLIPVMHVLERKGQRDFLDGGHFHLFPGPSWGGTIAGLDSKSYFAAAFGELVRRRCGPDAVLRVLVIDTTNTGNAVNNAVEVCQRAILVSGGTPSRIGLKVIGIVNTSHDQAKTPGQDKKLVEGTGRTAYVVTPSGFAPVSPLEDRRFTVFEPTTPGELLPFELAYWLAGNIPTEDRAELIGVEAVHESLSTISGPRAGRLKIEYGNGEAQQGTGLGSLPGRLISLLSLPLSSLPWDRMQALHALPPLDDEQRESQADVREASEGGLRLFELQPMQLLGRRKADPTEAVKALVRAKRLLTDVEVYWLRTLDPCPRGIARKVLASLVKGTCTAEEAVNYFRRAFPELASGDPGGEASATWWQRQIRSTPRAANVDEVQTPELISDDLPDVEFGDPGAGGETDEGNDTPDDLALNYVVLAGGIEEARSVLSALQSRGMSLDEIEVRLNQTWPVTVEKALTFVSPSDEEVALNFVLECGGHEAASACLENWITKHTGGS